jgi:pimeloyl-ACP methyl ester carboxylesterase
MREFLKGTGGPAPCWSILEGMRVNEVKTSALKMAYEAGGPRGGKPVILIHGWPDSPRTFDKVLPMLHGAGYRTIAPYLRGFGPTTFRSPMFGRKPRRTGQPVALAQDIIDLADALKLKSFDLVGHDWGARTAYALAALFPRKLERMVTIAVPFVPGSPKPPAPSMAQAAWYQWFFDTPIGQRSFREDPTAFCRRMWDTWSPQGWYGAQQFAAAAQSWTNADFVDVTLQYYRARWNPAAQDPDYGVLQTRFESTPTLDVPTLLLQGLEDGVTLPESTDGAGRYFTNGYRRILLDGVGHFPQRENPELVAEEIVRHLQGRAL